MEENSPLRPGPLHPREVKGRRKLPPRGPHVLGVPRGDAHVLHVGQRGAIFRELAAQGAHNINLVSPTPFARAVREALEAPLPVVMPTFSM